MYPPLKIFLFYFEITWAWNFVHILMSIVSWLLYCSSGSAPWNKWALSCFISSKQQVPKLFGTCSSIGFSKNSLKRFCCIQLKLRQWIAGRDEDGEVDADADLTKESADSDKIGMLCACVIFNGALVQWNAVDWLGSYQGGGGEITRKNGWGIQPSSQNSCPNRKQKLLFSHTNVLTLPKKWCLLLLVHNTGRC